MISSVSSKNTGTLWGCYFWDNSTTLLLLVVQFSRQPHPQIPIILPLPWFHDHFPWSLTAYCLGCWECQCVLFPSMPSFCFFHVHSARCIYVHPATALSPAPQVTLLCPMMAPLPWASSPHPNPPKNTITLVYGITTSRSAPLCGLPTVVHQSLIFRLQCSPCTVAQTLSCLMPMAVSFGVQQQKPMPSVLHLPPPSLQKPH